jgi:predicted DNA-binding ribbon-helix-helix protein
MWKALREIAAQQEKTVDQLVTEIDRDRAFGLSGAIRVYIVEFYRDRVRLP